MRTLVLLALVATSLAGCSGGDNDDFTVKAPAEAGGAYTFTAKVAGDSYKWNFGDSRPPVEGKTVEHSYGATSGNVTVTLTATTDGEEKVYQKRISLGDGPNAKPSFFLDAATNWAVVGQETTFSAARSSDPADDTLLFSWNCVFQGPLAPVGGNHDHGGGGGVPFAPDPTSNVVAGVATEPLPAPDRVVEGDFCENLQPDVYFHETATVAGTFSSPGTYRIFLLAKDAVHPSISGFFDIVVSEPGTKPDRMFAETYTGTFIGGRGGSAQDATAQLGLNDTFDRVVHLFTLELPATGLFLNLTHDQEQTSEVVMTLKRKAKVLEEGTGPMAFANPTEFVPGEYTVEVRLEQGLNTAYTLSVEGAYDVDPKHKYDSH